MTADQKRIRRWELWGILFIVLLGGMLHFTFALSGNNAFVGIFSAVNESVWEHLKLAFFPAAAYTVIEYFTLRRRPGVSQNFILAKAIGAYIMPITIVVIFYIYTSILGEHIFAIDIASFVIAAALGQYVSYKLLCHMKLPSVYNLLGLAMWILGILLFAIFTFFPPHLPIFQDPPSGGYGIIQ